jgi:branched-subunit amino acid aminotransferase/4-amino-4-deoxychorismate lyase
VSVRIEVNGRAVGAEMTWLAASSFGHFNAMQVRNGTTRGLDLHLDRLEAANRELFGVGIDAARVRELIRHALADTEDASVRVYVRELDGDAEPAIVVTVRGPATIASPQRLMSVDYQRPAAHLKHLATEQAFHTRAARRAGYDDALLTDGFDLVSESATANIGFFDGGAVVWPDAACLHGITLQLLRRELVRRGIEVRRERVRVNELDRFDGAFLSNARGIAAVIAIDRLELPVHPERMDLLASAYTAVAPDRI